MLKFILFNCSENGDIIETSVFVYPGYAITIAIIITITIKITITIYSFVNKPKFAILQN